MKKHGTLLVVSLIFSWGALAQHGNGESSQLPTTGELALFARNQALYKWNNSEEHMLDIHPLTRNEIVQQYHVSDPKEFLVSVMSASSCDNSILWKELAEQQQDLQIKLSCLFKAHMLLQGQLYRYTQTA